MTTRSSFFMSTTGGGIPSTSMVTRPGEDILFRTSTTTTNSTSINNTGTSTTSSSCSSTPFILLDHQGDDPSLGAVVGTTNATLHHQHRLLLPISSRIMRRPSSSSTTTMGVNHYHQHPALVLPPRQHTSTSSTNNNNNNNDNHQVLQDDSDEVTSTTINTLHEGIVVLGANQPSPRNFMDWTSQQAGRIVSSLWFKRSALTWILIVSVVLGLRTILYTYYRKEEEEEDDDPYMAISHPWIGSILDSILRLAMIHFTIEIIFEIAYFQSNTMKMGWILLDLLVLPCSWFISTNILILRAYRLMRALRLATGWVTIQIMVKTFLHAIPRLWSLLVLMLMHLYIFGVLLTGLVQQYNLIEQQSNNQNNNDNNQEERNVYPQLNTMVASFSQTSWTLFQIMTGGRLWSDLSDPITERIPIMGFLFVPFILLSMVLGMAFMIAIVTDSLSTIQQEHIWKSLDNNNNNNSTTMAKNASMFRPQAEATATAATSAVPFYNVATENDGTTNQSMDIWMRREGNVMFTPLSEINDTMGTGSDPVTVSAQSIQRLEKRIEELHASIQQLVQLHGSPQIR